MGILQQKHIVLGVCGSIAAYKVAELARNLALEGALVDVVMTEAAQRFVGAATFQALTGRPVLNDMWDLPEDGVVGHVSLGTAADIIVVAPATAHTLARFAAGFCDDLLTTAVLATRAPVLCVPAMNVQMYAAAATQENIATLRRRGFVVLEPAEGRMAEPMVGKGRLPEIATIEGEIRVLLGRRNGPLRGRRVVVTAGGTHEPIDPVRFVGNRSSGRMGYALAAAARDRGAEVTLIARPTLLVPPAGVTMVPVETALQMHEAVLQACEQADILIMNAAVADFRPVEAATQKIKKDGKEELMLRLVSNPDILGDLSQRRDLYKVGFAAETEDLLANAQSKLSRKGLDMIVVNEAVATIGQDDIQATIVEASGSVLPLPRQPKQQAAESLLDAMVHHLNETLDAEPETSQ
ncbi:MAG: bifunctional phosphopantothenoylcysteine decarboxylase/phosphopantothenate--cysteine ligase CoaBC [Chloroflexaceae bacterium]|nr:bifunctional phosphopantothenoylcysteine decarboxylase/phosphopantothenate--cysteine ligase CoaBC [Chloroflexaceae bacterium]